MARREFFPCYHSYFKKCEKLTDQELGRLFRALMMYSSTGERQELAGRESIAFDFIADDIDRAEESYLEKCEKNSQNGKRGGRPKNQTVKEKPNGFKKSQYEYKDEDKDEDDILPPNGGKNTHVCDPAVAAVQADYLNRINPSASPNSLDELAGFVKAVGPEVCERAFDIALDSKKTTWPYIRTILRDKQRKGVKCLADWDGLENNREHGKTGGGDTSWMKGLIDKRGRKEGGS